MNPPAPIAAINEWSCVLACVEWTCKSHGQDLSQNHIIHHYGLWFPEWFHRTGLMQRGDIPNLLLRLGFPIRNFAHFNEKEEVLSLFNKYHTKLFGGFVLTRKPTNHCYAFVSCAADLVTVMNPDPIAPGFVQFKWAELFADHDADILWIFQ